MSGFDTIEKQVASQHIPSAKHELVSHIIELSSITPQKTVLTLSELIRWLPHPVASFSLALILGVVVGYADGFVDYNEEPSEYSEAWLSDEESFL